MKKIQYRQSQGFTMVELLVALLIGVIIITGAFSLHTTSRKTQLVNEMQMNMAANARFAIDLISYDLRHAGMWGGTNRYGLIDCKSNNPCAVSTAAGEALPVPIPGDCVPGWYFTLDPSVSAIDNTLGNPYSTTCITAAENYRTGTDILEVHYADSNVTLPVNLLPNQVYIRSNFMNGRIFVGGTQPVLDSFDAHPVTRNHALYSYAYYISNNTDGSDGVPSLRRVALSDSTTMQNQLLISGVYDLQVQFGVDLTGDNQVNRYVDPHLVTDWSTVYAAKIWLVMRSETQQPGVNPKSFKVAGKPAVTLGGDGFRYFMVSSVVDLRNLK